MKKNMALLHFAVSMYVFSIQHSMCAGAKSFAKGSAKYLLRKRERLLHESFRRTKEHFVFPVNRPSGWTGLHQDA